MCAWRFCVISSRVCMEIVGFKFPYTYECVCRTHASSLCTSACEVVHGSHGSRTEMMCYETMLLVYRVGNLLPFFFPA